MNVVKFPYSTSRRVISRRPRRSKNGTPEERVAKAAANSGAIGSIVAFGAAASDPIYNAMERHRAAMQPYGAAVDVRASYDESDRSEVEWMDAAVDVARERCIEAAVDLINTSPTTIAGSVEVLRYIREQLKDDGEYMPHHLIHDSPGDARDTIGWVDAFLETVVDAMSDLAASG